jgi:hypothetical protein
MINFQAKCRQCDKMWTASPKLFAAFLLGEAAIHAKETGHIVDLNGEIVPDSNEETHA